MNGQIKKTRTTDSKGFVQFNSRTDKGTDNSFHQEPFLSRRSVHGDDNFQWLDKTYRGIMSREELDIMRMIVEQAYKNDDDYVNWSVVSLCEDTLKEKDNDCSRNNG